jgi:hypothetical protein
VKSGKKFIFLGSNPPKRMFGKYKIALIAPRESPLTPLKKGGIGLLVPLEKGDLGGFIPTKRIKNDFPNIL